MRDRNGWWVASVKSPNINGGYKGWLPCAGWCEDLWGADFARWRYHGEGVFVFLQEEDYILFMLKWS